MSRRALANVVYQPIRRIQLVSKLDVGMLTPAAFGEPASPRNRSCSSANNCCARFLIRAGLQKKVVPGTFPTWLLAGGNKP